MKKLFFIGALLIIVVLSFNIGIALRHFTSDGLVLTTQTDDYYNGVRYSSAGVNYFARVGITDSITVYAPTLAPMKVCVDGDLIAIVMPNDYFDFIAVDYVKPLTIEGVEYRNLYADIEVAPYLLGCGD